jgi:hypothetical protein
MATKQKEKGMSTKAKVAIGVGAALALAAASYYFFGPNGKKNRNKLKGWMIRMKGEIVEKMEKAKDMTESAYHNIVDAVAARYKNAVAEGDLAGFVADLKKQWKGFARSSVSRKGASKKSGAPRTGTAGKKAASRKRSSQ